MPQNMPFFIGDHTGNILRIDIGLFADLFQYIQHRMGLFDL